MGKRKIFLIIGNGFTMNLLSHSNILTEINSSYPLSNFKCNEIDYEYMKNMPGLSEVIEARRNDFTNEFECIESILNTFGRSSEIACYIRRFLAIAYSQLYLNIRGKVDCNTWKWSKWISDNRNNISGCLSLNYDLILENILDFSKIPYCRISTAESYNVKLLESIGLVNRNDYIPIFKPHGSIDFDLPRLISGDEYSMCSCVTENCQMYDSNSNPIMEIISEKDFLSPRGVIDLIPPNQHNYYRNYNWVNNTYKELKKDISDVDTVILFGFSYSKFDRPEFGEVISNLKNKKVTFYDINRSINKELKGAIERKGHKYKFVGGKEPF